ncbi:MAG: radical SAM family heme chaperone HemW [Oscillospiraceae bacterium]|jgi:putative oxygen-independent coproporphyrinogen III oxidase
MGSSDEKAGIYIHVPFCASKCPYCDFYSVKTDSSLRERYLSALTNQIRSMPRVNADTIYIGGGTPSQLSPSEIEHILGEIFLSASVERGAEITMEANPGDCSADYLSTLRSAGITRLSLGVQSLDDAVLRNLGRRHSRDEALRALTAAAGTFKHVNADIMLATPGQTPENEAETIRLFSECGADHVSAYILKCYPGTPFGDKPPRGLPDDDGQAEFYLAACRQLEALGYKHYEISNFSLPGCRSRHNMKYWDCRDYIGLGPAAHSCLQGRRFYSEPDLPGFLSTWSSPSDRFEELMKEEGDCTAEDYVMLRLRLSDGLDLSKCRERFGKIPRIDPSFLENCERSGLMTVRGDLIRLTDRGMVVSNSIISEMIDFG